MFSLSYEEQRTLIISSAQAIKLKKLRANLVEIFSLVVLALYLFPDASLAQVQNRVCASSSCGNLSISYPFRLDSDPDECGEPGYQLVCENNSTTALLEYGKFFVEDISYVRNTTRLVDASLDRNMCSIPRSSLLLGDGCEQMNYSSTMFVLSCNIPINSSLYVDASACSNISSSQHTYFFLLNQQTSISDFNESCEIEARFPFSSSSITGLSASDIYNKLLMGFEMEWIWFFNYNRTCLLTPVKLSLHDILQAVKFGLETYIDSFVFFLLGGPRVMQNNDLPPNSTYFKCVIITGGTVVTRALLGISILLAVVVRKLRRRHFSADDTIEEFLQKQNHFMPIRYTYSELNKMTGGFKNKLGQGGYGSVYKGKLRSGGLVAIKLLNKVKGNGQDFINEVATIGRIHHANVLPLIGFCVEGSKQALVYDFMPNGSLDKVIYSRENISLSWKKMFEIALGVAHGIEYLHRGCDMQILHFDIKPHNILLDESFNPKVSDFGLAKLFAIDESVVSLTAARGTPGYIAPELFYKNIGGISYKADVYSYGMLLMEMVGRSRGMKAVHNQSSQIYFPTWVYDRVDQGEDLELGDVTDFEKNVVRKILIVGLWCIQMKPAMRPSMSKVLEMLDSDIDHLEMPPKPCLFPHELPSSDHVNISLAAAPTMSLDAR